MKQLLHSSVSLSLSVSFSGLVYGRWKTFHNICICSKFVDFFFLLPSSLCFSCNTSYLYKILRISLLIIHGIEKKRYTLSWIVHTYSYWTVWIFNCACTCHISFCFSVPSRRPTSNKLFRRTVPFLQNWIYGNPLNENYYTDTMVSRSI